MSLRRAVLAAAAAAAAGALLIGGGATYAAWSDSTQPESTKITAGDLTAGITQKGPSDFKIGEDPSIVVAPGSRGIIPGAQAQRWTYTVVNSTKSATAATGAIDIAGTPSDVDDYEAVRHYLRASATIDGTTKDVPITAFGKSGFSHSVDLGKKLSPGESATVTLDLSIPATAADPAGKTVDGAAELLNRRSANLQTQNVFEMENSFRLKQAGTP